MNCTGLTLFLSSGDHGKLVNAKCGCWKCDTCGEELRTKWRDRAWSAFAKHAMWEISICTEPQFNALARRLRKYGRGYFRIRFGAVSHVFHQPLAINRKFAPDPSKWLGATEAAELFAETLDRPGVSRVSCSKAYRGKSHKWVPSGWKREAIKRQSIQDVNAFLEKLSIKERVRDAASFDKRYLEVILLRDFPSDLNEAKPRKPREYKTYGIHGSFRSRTEAHVGDHPHEIAIRRC